MPTVRSETDLQGARKTQRSPRPGQGRQTLAEDSTDVDEGCAIPVPYVLRGGSDTCDPHPVRLYVPMRGSDLVGKKVKRAEEE
ncbi:hypothetical protein WOLCODRAFT_158283 [Wolfiporia cocos MD-104 SS10]|uniref:Uncharacterized protein n=1 Tax=Wolfiporia cocos (strain MD-104) TaxID=742152 RepID=A0A2H3J6L7_WOLCO|nr:hypothetical protein WOLCODRAFT_158283 [Wolfiporia cocos MD-104 SS10]